MTPIQMVDLQSQYQKIKPEIKAAMNEVLESSSYINGVQVKKFQTAFESYLGVKHVIPCANGTDALQIAMMALGLKPGDEIITVDFTFAATVEVIALLGLTPVLVDVAADSFNINISALKKAITPKTKAIVPVHLFGQCANMEAILEIAMANNLYVIEDTAQAVGANYTFSNGSVQKAGTMGQVGTTSFFPSKNLGCYGDGGAIFTDDDTLAKKMRGIVNHGMYKRYYHDVVGVNSRLDSLQAAVLNVKLKYLDSYCNARKTAATYYTKAFEKIDGIITPVISNFSTHVFHQYTLKIKNGLRDTLHQYLNEKGIPNAIYYPVPLHLQKAYKNTRYKEADFETTNALCKSVISLPMHTELETQQQDFIIENILKFIKKS